MAKKRGRTPTARPWEPMRQAARVPLTAEQESQLRTIGASDALFEELNNAEIWKNHKYVVTVTRFEDGSVQELSIRRCDRKAAHDWRDFQRIKTEIAGPDIEAIELYPAEGRLMDTANQYYLFCLPPGRRFPMGYQGPRNLRDADEAVGNSQQRALPADWIDYAQESS